MVAQSSAAGAGRSLPRATPALPACLGFKDYDWVEWTIERNVTETLGAGASVVLDPQAASPFESSIPIKNMHDLEWLAYYTDPPRWPTAIFGEIKPDLAAAGQPIFQSRCAHCTSMAMMDVPQPASSAARNASGGCRDRRHSGAQNLLPDTRQRPARHPA
jgi:hypothetical protein